MDDALNLIVPSQAIDSDALDSPGPSRKRARANRDTSVDSEDLDTEETPSAGPSKSATPAPSTTKKAAKAKSGATPQVLKAVGQFMECGECTKRFTVVGPASR